MRFAGTNWYNVVAESLLGHIDNSQIQSSCRAVNRNLNTLSHSHKDFIVAGEGMGKEGAVTLTVTWDEMKAESDVSSLHHKCADWKLHCDTVTEFGLDLGCLCSQIDNYYRKSIGRK